MPLAPWSQDAERAVIGACLISPSVMADIRRIVEPSDFRFPAHQALFAAIESRHDDGHPVDPVVIATDCATSVTDVDQTIAACLDSHASTQAALAHARKVADLAATRRIESAASQALSRIHDDHITDPAMLLDGLEADIASIDLPSDPRPVQGLWVAADLLSAEFTEPPWVAPGLLREAWRVLFVGVEGGGKSTMLRQIVTAISCGQHPFTFEPIEPKPGLIIDCENPESVVRDGLRRMHHHIDDANLVILCRPGGLNIRVRRDRDLLHRVFAKVQPKVCAIGPLYKLYRQERGEPDEQAAVAAQNVLDELRVAHGCALIIETHAPKGGAVRELIPFGSSAWLRWPELGWKLLPRNDHGDPDPEGHSIAIGRFRGDRVHVDIPARFDRDPHCSWPWRPYWPKGMPKGNAA